jgi:hypothetical protein
VKYVYDTRTARYRGAGGRFLTRAAVRAEVDRVIRASEARIENLTTQLREGQLSLAGWRTSMREEVKAQHLMHAMAAKGGKAMMTPADYGRVGELVRRQYEYLERFTSQIASGKLALDGRVATRAKLYAQSARQTYHQVERTEFLARAFDQERNVLGNAEHCQQCIDQTNLSWVPIGTLIPIGQRTCKVNCRCRLQYQNSTTGEVSAA